MTLLEEQLRDLFTEDATHAPAPDRVLSEVIRTTQRRRRTYTALIAAAAVTAAVGIPAVVLQRGDVGPDTSAPTTLNQARGCPIAAALLAGKVLSGQGRVGTTNPKNCSFEPLPTQPAGTVYDAELSPDGTKLVAVRRPDGTESSELLVLDVASGKEQILGVDSEGGVGAPTWSPDGTAIAYWADPERSGHPGIWIYDLATNTTRLINQGDTAQSNPIWSPDGRSLLFGRSGDPPTTVIVDLDTGEEHVMSYRGPAAFSPDSTQLVAFTGPLAPQDANDVAPGRHHLAVIDIETDEILDQSAPIEPDTNNLIGNPDIAWDDQGFVVTSGLVAITFDNNLTETAHHDLGGEATLGLGIR